MAKDGQKKIAAGTNWGRHGHTGAAVVVVEVAVVVTARLYNNGAAGAATRDHAGPPSQMPEPELK